MSGIMDVHETVTVQCSDSTNPMASYYNSSFPGFFQHQYMINMYIHTSIARTISRDRGTVSS